MRKQTEIALETPNLQSMRKINALIGESSSLIPSPNPKIALIKIFIRNVFLVPIAVDKNP
jgi:hypothetical protein